MKKTYSLLLLMLLLLALAGTGAAFDQVFYARQPGGSYGMQSDEGDKPGRVEEQLALMGGIFNAYIPQAVLTGGETVPAEDSGEDTLVSEEDGWQVVTSHTYLIRENRSFYNPETQESESHEVGFDLNVSMDSGKEFLIPADDADIPGTQPRYRIYMGKGGSPQWSISNVIVPNGLEDTVSYEAEVEDPFTKYNEHELVAEVNYEYTVSAPSTPPSVKVRLFAHELHKVNLQTRNDDGEESPERVIDEAHGILGDDLFNAAINIQLLCNDEDEPASWASMVPRAEQEARIFYHWNVWERGINHKISWDPADWQSSDRDGDVIFRSGSGAQQTDLSWFRVPAPALYARVVQPGYKTFLSKYFTYDNLENFRGTINVQVITPGGDPLPDMEVEFWGGQNLGGSVKTETDTNGEAEITYPPGTDGTDYAALTMTAFPKVSLGWRLTQVVDNPAYIVRDHRAPLFVSPTVYVNIGYPSSELSGVNIEVYDVDNPDNVIARNQAASFRGRTSETGYFGEYSDREVVILGKHRAYIEIEPEELVSRRLGVRAVVSDSDRGRRETTVSLGTAIDPGADWNSETYQPHELYESRRSFNFMFVPLRVGAWETGEISYSEAVLGQQEDFIRKIFPAPIGFNRGLPYSVPRQSGWLWGEESQRSYQRRIIRTLNRLQKMDRAAGTDLVVGMVPPGFLGASGLQDPGAFHSNWEVLGASHFAVLIDPSEVRPHHTLHEFLHTLGFKDVYPSDEVLTDLRVGWRPLSANGHDGQFPINNIMWRTASRTYEAVDPVHEAVMYDHAWAPWVTDGEYSALLDYAVQPTGGASEGWQEAQALAQTLAQTLAQIQTTPQEENGEMLLISGEALDANLHWGNPQEIILDPASVDITAYTGGARNGLDAAITIEAVDGEIIAEEVPMDANRHRPGAYLFSWNPAEAGAAPGEYGVHIHLEDPTTGQERESAESDLYDFTFTLYEPNSAPVFSEPETYKNELEPVEAGDTVVIPYEVDDPDGDELQMEVSSPLTEHGLELIRHDNNNGELRWTANQIGEFEIFLTAEDPGQAQAGVIFRITVAENLVTLNMRAFLDNQPPPDGINPGTVTPDPRRPHTVSAHTPVTVTATPASGYEFVRWYVTPPDNLTVADENAAETTVTLNADATVRAVFTETGESQSLGDLEIGDRVVDPSWEWEHRLGAYYSDEDRAGNPVPEGVEKPVTWIVAAKDHYDVEDNRPHVTLIAEELIARHPFDDSTIRGEKWEFGSNHWGNSGLPDADYGLRPFLNSMDKDEYAYAGNGFHAAFSERFRSGVLKTTVPNIVWDTEESYTTYDYVFAPSLTELGLGGANTTGTVLPYFEPDTGRQPKLQASLPGLENTDLAGIEYDFYWTRQPGSASEYYVNVIAVSGISSGSQAPTSSFGVRPVINLDADMQVALTANADGAYEITGGPGEGTAYYGDVDGDGQVTVADAILVLRHIVGLIDLEDEYGPGALERAKVSANDGLLSVGDAILILRRIVGLIHEFPAETL